MSENKKRQMPIVPQELLDMPRPRGILAAEKHLNELVEQNPNCLMRLAECERNIRDGLVKTSTAYLRIIFELREAIDDAVAWIDQGKTPGARQLLHVTLQDLDEIDFSPVTPAENK